MMSDEAEAPAELPKSRLIAIALDEKSTATSNSNIEHEREVAIFDILEGNSFALEGRDDGPYKLTLGLVEDRLVLTVNNEANEAVVTHMLSLTPLKRIMKDYFMICESYYEAIRTATPSQIETIDMARRGLHNEGSDLLKERLNGKVEVDFDTARRLFTLVCVLHWRG
jgi:uncharacterized protein (UPF0262 family)